jgi:hypothetical protein
MRTKFWKKNLKKRDYLEYLCVNRSIIFKRNLKEIRLDYVSEFMWFRIGTVSVLL